MATEQGTATLQIDNSRRATQEDGPVNLEERRQRFGLAAERGNAGAQYSLGFMHVQGHGGPVDHTEARRLYGLAAEQGTAEAQCFLGRMHGQGQGGPVNHA